MMSDDRALFWLLLTGFILIVLWYVLLHLFTMSSNLSIYTFFDIEDTHSYILFFKVLMNLSATTGFPSLCTEHIFIAFFFAGHDFIDLLLNSLPLSMQILFGLWLDIIKIFWIALVIVITFFVFQRSNPSIFTKIPSLNLLINCISARSAPQIWSIKGEYTFCFLNFLIIGLCNYNNSWSGIFSFLVLLPEAFLSKNL